jgi:hypothetical protein
MMLLWHQESTTFYPSPDANTTLLPFDDQAPFGYSETRLMRRGAQKCYYLYADELLDETYEPSGSASPVVHRDRLNQSRLRASSR